jgi:hypothetical protein
MTLQPESDTRQIRRPLRVCPTADIADTSCSKEKSRPQMAALNSNRLIEYQAAIGIGFDFRR